MTAKYLAPALGALLALSAFVTIPGAARAADATGKPDTIRFLSGTSGGSWYPIVVGMAEIFSKEGVKTSTEVGGGNSNIINISNGNGDIAFAPTPAAASAAVGEAPFEDKLTNVRGLFLDFDSLISMNATKDSGIQTVPDLKSRKVALQDVNAGVTSFLRMILQTYDMSEDDLNIVTRGGAGQAMAAVQDRRADFFITGGVPPEPVVSELSASRPVTLLPVDDDHFQSLLKLNGGFTHHMVPAGIYPGVDEPVPGVFYGVATIANASMSDDTAYWIVKTIAEHLDQIRKSNAVMADYSVETMANFAGVPMHPGAARYYREVGVLK